MALPEEYQAYQDANEVTRKRMDRDASRQFRLERADFHLGVLSVVSGMIIALAFLGVTGWLIDGNHDAAGVILGSVDLVALTSVFVYAAVKMRSSGATGATS